MGSTSPRHSKGITPSLVETFPPDGVVDREAFKVGGREREGGRIDAGREREDRCCLPSARLISIKCSSHVVSSARLMQYHAWDELNELTMCERCGMHSSP